MYFWVSSLMILPSVLSSAQIARILISFFAVVSTSPDAALLADVEVAATSEDDDCASDCVDVDTLADAFDEEDAAPPPVVLLLPHPASNPTVIADAMIAEITLL